MRVNQVRLAHTRAHSFLSSHDENPFNPQIIADTIRGVLLVASSTATLSTVITLYSRVHPPLDTMLDFDNLPSTIGLLTLCILLNVFYKYSSSYYPHVPLPLNNNAELQFLILTFLLLLTSFIWFCNLGYHWNLLKSLYSDIYQFLIPKGSAWWLKWFWASYFGILLTITPFFKTRAALRRMLKKTPLVALKNSKKPSLWTWIKERKRLREAQAWLATFSRDVKVNLERSNSQERVGAVAIDDVEESTPSTIEIFTENFAIRRTQARMSFNFQCIYLLAIGCYLDNHLVWNAGMSDGWGLYCDMLSVGIMYIFPVSFLMSYLVLFEAAFDHRNARILIRTKEEAERGEDDVHEGTPLIIITAATDV